VVPPGHKFLPAATGTKVVMCDTSAGEYRTGWTTVTDPATTTTNINCNTCGGSGSSLILSDTTEPVNTFSADTSDPSSPVIISAPVTASSCCEYQLISLVQYDDDNVSGSLCISIMIMIMRHGHEKWRSQFEYIHEPPVAVGCLHSNANDFISV
jgi:hypothetical protein